MRDAFVEERFGIAARQRYRSQATSALRELLSSTAEPPGGWVDFDLFIEANVLADRLFGQGDLRLVWDMGRFAATHNMGVWRGLVMRHMRPSTFLGIASGLWGSHYDGGKLRTRTVGDGILINIADFPSPHRAHCLAIAGWVQGSLEVGPRTNVVVEEQSCRALGAPECAFRIAWQD
ncbi:MAG: hypothetical protein KC776_43615 [Myxococcales bacterium]|nr:hypothetical protein [Myxococcales bacterium]MCB9576515.1 hypothetical protein [Polyangiaceae bacterium]